MKYIIANEKKAQAAGFKPALHVTVKGRMVLNEREVMQCASLTGGMVFRTGALGGKLCATAAEAKMALNTINNPLNK